MYAIFIYNGSLTLSYVLIVLIFVVYFFFVRLHSIVMLSVISSMLVYKLNGGMLTLLINSLFLV